MEFEKTKTCENLARAFAAECMEGARYQFLGKMAMVQGYSYLQTILRTIAKDEMGHAQVLWDLITSHGGGKIANVNINTGYPFKNGSIEEQLKFASEYEKSENTSIYPTFAKVAEDEGFADIAEKFKLIAEVENTHYLILNQLYEGFKTGKLYENPKETPWRCNMCGYMKRGKTAFKTCALCGAKQGEVQIPINQV
ncbi:MAG: hypothetical protein LBN07_00075 [Christensenellaceae bacterium]|nr:hypothetical protein [Christensenellaceae bacterium]